MGLREQAALDALRFLEDQCGFGWPITLTNPDGAKLRLTGFSNDIGQTIDADTGMLVSGQQASVALPLLRLKGEQWAIPRMIPDQSMKPWLVTFDDVAGVTRTYKVRETLPDQAIGVIVCMLEAYSFNKPPEIQPVIDSDSDEVVTEDGGQVFE
jgi:hypothetical protein